MMFRRIGSYHLATAILVFVGCSGPDPPPPKITLEEYKEVQQHLWPIDAEHNRSYFSSAKGEELTTKMLRSIFGDRGVSILRGATRAEAFHVADRDSDPRPSVFVDARSDPRFTLGDVEGYPVISVGSEQGEAFVAKLTTYLLDGRRYFVSLDCEIYGPGVVFRLWRGKESVVLIFRYKCNYLEVSAYNAWGEVHSTGTYYSFDNPNVLKRLMKEAFPDDREIQSLKEI